ncbi:hypothetical protein Anas_04108 [Armadillidium nasatum]|uniref:Uncharacterized protein n=1 Tax=Armadillidium nasatum TaxID=96803 RepID=A0A5N5STI6_9CRUS|nr:hypothetical protein Anas_04108 [Armadillidium nasatum]
MFIKTDSTLFINEDIGDWLSWWRVKKSRYCVVPAKPRVRRTANLIRHRYFHNLFYSLEMVKPLLYESCPCQNETKPLLDANKNETSYALYCFGIDQGVGEGHFDNVYKFYWGKDPVFIIGVPYSNFGPSIKLESTLYMLQVTPEFGESLAGILKAQNYDAESANLTAVPFEFKNEDKNATEETSSTTAAVTATATTTAITPTSK